MNCRTSLLLLVLLVPTSHTLAQAVTPEQANTAFQAQDWPAAAAAYQTLAAQEPGNGQYWYRLGVTRLSQQQYAQAVEALRKSQEIGFAPVFTQYNLAAAHAQLGQSDEALAALDQLARSGVNLLQRLRDDADFASLRADPRFEATLTEMDRTARPCHYDAQHQAFDFWVGVWDVFNPAGQQVGTNTIEKILDGCVLLEHWTSRAASTGKSFNYIDKADGKWRQLWVDSSGNNTLYVGTFRDGSLVYETTNMAPGPPHLRMTFTPLPDGRVRQFIEQTTDGGQTWTVFFDGYYARKPASTSATGG
jgi:hypothetical protein